MNALVLILAVVIPFPLCLFRMKKYNIPLWKMLLIYVIISTVGAIGACIGSVIAGGTISGKRLYGLMIFDTAALLLVSPLLRINMDDLCDFVAVPIMAVCFSSKIDCLVKGCCYGITLYQLEGQLPVKFPSAIVEMSVWGIMTVLLLLIEKKGSAKGFLWPIGLIWFGVFRFLVDFLRGAALEKEILLLGLTGGQFWSLITLVLGIVWMFIALSKKSSQKPCIGRIVKAVIGKVT